MTKNLHFFFSSVAESLGGAFRFDIYSEEWTDIQTIKTSGGALSGTLEHTQRKSVLSGNLSTVRMFGHR